MKTKTTLHECIKSMVAKGHLNESQSKMLESILNDVEDIKSPEAVKKFMDKNKGKIAATASKLQGKQRNWFLKAVDFVQHAISKGLSFIGDHWLDILKLMAVISVGIFAYRMFPLVSSSIEDLFDRKKHAANAAQKASAALARDSEKDFQALEKIDAMATAASNGNEQLKGKIMAKVGDAWKAGGRKAAEDAIKDPEMLRRSTATAGNTALLREGKTKSQIQKAIKHWQKILESHFPIDDQYNRLGTYGENCRDMLEAAFKSYGPGYSADVFVAFSIELAKQDIEMAKKLRRFFGQFASGRLGQEYEEYADQRGSCKAIAKNLVEMLGAAIDSTNGR